jgi:hypothetical protein
MALNIQSSMASGLLSYQHLGPGGGKILKTAPFGGNTVF